MIGVIKEGGTFVAEDRHEGVRASVIVARGLSSLILQQEKPLQWEARTPQRRVAPARHEQRKPTHSNEGPA